jgi:hypothetical protein
MGKARTSVVLHFSGTSLEWTAFVEEDGGAGRAFFLNAPWGEEVRLAGAGYPLLETATTSLQEMMVIKIISHEHIV